MTPLVTIAIASYNNSRYIERCVHSVINQSFKNLEILIVDDGSNDDTLSRLEKYKEDNRVIVFSKDNGGLSSARQLALEKAKGDFISFIDADDFIAVDYVERLLNKLIVDRADICVCSTRVEDMYGNHLQIESKILSCEESQGPIYFSIDEISDPNELLSAKVFLSDSWNKMFRMSFLRDSGVSFNMPKGLNGTDTVFNRRLFLRCPVYTTISESVNIHIIYRSSAAHRKGKDLLSTTMFITSQLLHDVKVLGVGQLMAKRISVFYYKGLLSSMIDKFNETSGIRERGRGLQQCYNRHIVFVNENTAIALNIKDSKSMELKSFLFVLYYMKLLLPFYIKLNQVVFK